MATSTTDGSPDREWDLCKGLSIGVAFAFFGGYAGFIAPLFHGGVPFEVAIAGPTLWGTVRGGRYMARGTAGLVRDHLEDRRERRAAELIGRRERVLAAVERAAAERRALEPDPPVVSASAVREEQHPAPAVLPRATPGVPLPQPRVAERSRERDGHCL